MPYHLSQEAEWDLQNIWQFIARPSLDNVTTADSFINGIENTLSNLAANPYMGRERLELGENLRSMRFRDYIILYHPAEDSIQVDRIIHGSRDITRLF